MIVSFLTFFFFVFSLFSASSIFAASNILFTDNFNDGDFSDWQISGGNWMIKEIEGSYMVGTVVDAYDTVVKATAGDVNWDNYIYEVDMIAFQGADKNIIFRVKDNDNKYGIHMRSENGGVSSLVCIERWSSKNSVPDFWSKCWDWNFVNNKIYHLKTVAFNNNIKFYIDNQLFKNFTNTSSLPFNQNFFLIMNCAMGGNLGGAIDPNFSSSTFEIDYVRVYN